MDVLQGRKRKKSKDRKQQRKGKRRNQTTAEWEKTMGKVLAHPGPVKKTQGK